MAWTRRVSKRMCMHHNRRTGESWIDDMLIEAGMRKMLWCRVCQRTWFT